MSRIPFIFETQTHGKFGGFFPSRVVKEPTYLVIQSSSEKLFEKTLAESKDRRVCRYGLT